MKLAVVTDAHIYETPDGKHWTPAIYGYNFWTRYLSVFDEVRVIARLKKIDNLDSKMQLVDGPNLEIYGIPFYQGPLQLINNIFPIYQCLKNSFYECDAALFRMPSPTGFIAYNFVNKNIPIAGEIVYDPTDDLKENNKGIILNLINRIISNQLAVFCRNANAISYVTENTIQKHYPSHSRLYGEDKRYFETSYSTITLNDNAFTGPRDFKNKKRLILALSDVAMNTERKGERTLLNAMKVVVEKGYDVRAIIIGDGSKKQEFMDLAKLNGLQDRTFFTGLLSSTEEVREKLLQADLYVFPTQAEGLPRGVIEAMAVGLPVLCSSVGGLPEIIDEDCRFSPQDEEGYANKICELFDNKQLLNELSIRNFKVAQRFKNSYLQPIRDNFYKKLLLLCN